ncbi:hypothetical protein HRR83_002665 [Exophiala dermatitidis]|uniref:Auxin efflux carrier n=2 Tax=Exophiala dermatitidis TaxID=5970 RepID=H6C022_EXODN|nr:uncharacterized protein HMPREF1120_05219 [Exophiala dermatitidis NIH/UT8656]KAJ4516921.1 hypothetical protein HRR75_003581 [Exophiala dermatitidis]EHY57171.1 hypothetical protein HMPREF1120_05219 [Exophiala dermatitidis NIH/UT8656]KAJ4520902.1 hypothetical protein HRR74_003903 [Exophiala dermatitidis]KAJ4522044.1 hypothetical protein HRR73_003243 [Exophiala dermatitidis]KAJ4537439.1 hypothetical protein HRR76_005441 [Exophiala dermatitidis]
MAPTGLLDSFLAAIQASLSVLLVIFYGGVAAHLKLLNQSNSKAISKICVRMFLPALLIVKIGSELHPGSASRYGIIFIWAILCHLVSFVLGIVAHLWLGMPDWTTVALMFNNTTSYPLLLIAALDETGILRSLIVTDETTRAAVERAKSYFLVFATISSCLTFAVGPRLIDSEHPPDPNDDDEDDEKETDTTAAGNANINSEVDDDNVGRQHQSVDELTTLLDRDSQRRPSVITFGQPNSFFPSVRKPSIQSDRRRASILSATELVETRRRPSVVPRRQWVRLGPTAKWWLLFISDFFNAPLLGAILGTVIGLITPLHRAFFNDTEQGGIFTAWLTSSLDNIGGLFVPLPVLVAGVSLYTSMKEVQRRRKENADVSQSGDDDGIRRRSGGGGGRVRFSDENDATPSNSSIGNHNDTNTNAEANSNSGPSTESVSAYAPAASKGKSKTKPFKPESHLPWLTVTYILIIRFVVWPIASIALIYVVASRTNLLGSDPMLWFAMMLMPTGPPAMKLITLVQVSDGDEEDEMNIAKLLTISYIISPILSITVVGGLRASQAAIRV